MGAEADRGYTRLKIRFIRRKARARLRNEQVNLALRDAISVERLRRYLASQSNDLEGALRLYEWNMRLSEAFYTPLSCLEVCLRNKAHAQVAREFGADWLLQPGVPGLNDFSRSQLSEAQRKCEGTVSTGKLIAELRFAFWVGLLGPQYDGTLWRQALFRCFSPRLPRRQVHGRMNAIRRLRNRVAHHEPIFHRPCDRLHSEILEAIGWMCPKTRDWAERQSRVPSVLAGH